MTETPGHYPVGSVVIIGRQTRTMYRIVEWLEGDQAVLLNLKRRGEESKTTAHASTLFLP